MTNPSTAADAPFAAVSPELQKEIAKQAPVLTALRELRECAISYARQHLASHLTATELTDASVGGCMVYAEALRQAAIKIDTKELGASPYPQSVAEIRQAAEAEASHAYDLALQSTRVSVLRLIADDTTPPEH